MKKLLIAMLFSVSSASASVTGNTLLEHMESNEYMLRSYSLGYITSIFQFTRGTAHCSPDGVTFGQARDLVQNYLKTNATYRHMDGYVIAIMVFSAAWPCKGDV